MKKLKITILLSLIANMVAVGLLIKKEKEIDELISTNDYIKKEVSIMHQSIKNINNTIDEHTNQIKEYTIKFNSLKTELLDYGYILED